MDVKEKLDLLAEFHSKRDSLELEKRELLNEIQVPAEVEKIVNDGMAKIAAIDEGIRSGAKEYDAKIDAKLAAVVIPKEYQDELEEIDRARAEIVSKMGEVEAQKRAIRNEQAEFHAAMFDNSAKLKQTLREQIELQTRDVYKQLDQRKAEIEAEFSGKAEDVAANILKLENEIRDDLKKEAAEKLEKDPKAKDLSVKGKYFHAVYVRGRVTWNTDKMDAWVIDHPFLKEARKEGDPSITIRKV